MVSNEEEKNESKQGNEAEKPENAGQGDFAMGLEMHGAADVILEEKVPLKSLTITRGRRGVGLGSRSGEVQDVVEGGVPEEAGDANEVAGHRVGLEQGAEVDSALVGDSPPGDINLGLSEEDLLPDGDIGPVGIPELALRKGSQFAEVVEIG